MSTTQQKFSFFVRSDISFFFLYVWINYEHKREERKRNDTRQFCFHNTIKQGTKDLYTCTIPTCEENFYIQIQQDRQILIHTHIYIGYNSDEHWSQNRNI